MNKRTNEKKEKTYKKIFIRDLQTTNFILQERLSYIQIQKVPAFSRSN